MFLTKYKTFVQFSFFPHLSKKAKCLQSTVYHHFFSACRDFHCWQAVRQQKKFDSDRNRQLNLSSAQFGVNRSTVVCSAEKPVLLANNKQKNYDDDDCCRRPARFADDLPSAVAAVDKCLFPLFCLSLSTQIGHIFSPCQLNFKPIVSLNSFWFAVNILQLLPLLFAVVLFFFFFFIFHLILSSSSAHKCFFLQDLLLLFYLFANCKQCCCEKCLLLGGY